MSLHRPGTEHPIAVFGMDTITLAGPLEAKLEAIRGAGFAQVMLKANDLVGHPQGWQAAVKAVHASGLRGTGFQVYLADKALLPDSAGTDGKDREDGCADGGRGYAAG